MCRFRIRNYNSQRSATNGEEPGEVHNIKTCCQVDDFGGQTHQGGCHQIGPGRKDVCGQDSGEARCDQGDRCGQDDRREGGDQARRQGGRRKTGGQDDSREGDGQARHPVDGSPPCGQGTGTQACRTDSSGSG